MSWKASKTEHKIPTRSEPRLPLNLYNKAHTIRREKTNTKGEQTTPWWEITPNPCDSYMEVFPTLVAEKYDLFCIKKYTTIINREKYVCVPRCAFLKQQNFPSIM